MRFTLSTFTRASPKMPNCGCSVHFSMMARISSSLLPVLFAKRSTWYSAAAGEMCGSKPLPEFVTRSLGMGSSPFSGCAAWISSMRSCTPAAKSSPAGLRFEAPYHSTSSPSSLVNVPVLGLITRPHI